MSTNVHEGPLWEVDIKQEVWERLNSNSGLKPAYSFVRINEPTEEHARLFGILCLEDDDGGGNEIRLTNEDVNVFPVHCEKCGERATKIYRFHEDDGEEVEWELCDSCYEKEQS